MKFSTDRQLFITALTRAALVVAKLNVQPILGGVLIQAGNDVMTCTGTNLDQSIQVDSYANVHNAGDIVIDHKQALAWLKALDKSYSSISVEHDASTSTVILASGTSRVTVEVLGAADDYPNVMREFCVASYSISPASLDVIGRKLAPFARSDKHTNPGDLLAGISFIQPKDGRVELCATDGSRMASYLLPEATSNHNIATEKAIIPVAALNLLVKLQGKSKCAIDFAYGSDHIKMTTENGMLLSRLTSGEYPRYRELFPNNQASGYRIFNRLELISVCKQVIAHKLDARCLIIVGLEVGSKDGKIRASIQGNTSDSMPIAFSAEYLKDFCESTDDKEIRINHFGKETGACLLVEKTEDLRQLLMPTQAMTVWDTQKHKRVDVTGWWTPKTAPASAAV